MGNSASYDLKEDIQEIAFRLLNGMSQDGYVPLKIDADDLFDIFQQNLLKYSQSQIKSYLKGDLDFADEEIHSLEEQHEQLLTYLRELYDFADQVMEQKFSCVEMFSTLESETKTLIFVNEEESVPVKANPEIIDNIQKSLSDHMVFLGELLNSLIASNHLLKPKEFLNQKSAFEETSASLDRYLTTQKKFLSDFYWQTTSEKQTLLNPLTLEKLNFDEPC